MANDVEWLKDNNSIEYTQNVLSGRKRLRSEPENESENEFSAENKNKKLCTEENNQLVTNDINQELLDHDIGPSDDSVFHIAEAISASALKVEDKYLKSKEGELSVEEAEGQISFIVCNAKKDIKSMPLVELSDLLKQYNIPLKRATTKLLAEFCENAFNVIKYHKDIQKCVNDLSNALFEYNNLKNPEKCKEILKIKEKLRKAIELSGNRAKSANHILDLVFVRSAVDKFYKKLGNLGDHKVLRDLKFTFNSLGSDIANISSDIVNLSREGIKLSGGHIKGLTYGFGFYPSSVDISINNLSEKSQEVKISTDLRALASLSKEYVLTINGKNFEVLNTGSRNDRNCAFRAISVGAGYGPNGYNTIQQEVVKGAKKLKDEFLCKLDDEYKERIFKELIRKHADFIYLEEKDKMPKIENELSEIKKNGELEIKIKELLDNFDETYNKGFVSGMFQIDYLFAAIGLNRPICKFDAKEGKHRTFFPDGRIEEGIDYDYSTVGEPIYVGEITGHAEALIPIDSENSQNVKNSTELDKKASEMKNLIKEHISSVIYDAIYDADKRDDELRRIITEKNRLIIQIVLLKNLLKMMSSAKKQRKTNQSSFMQYKYLTAYFQNLVARKEKISTI